MRDVDIETFEAQANRLPPLLRQRCRHVVYENDRTLRATKVLQQGDIASKTPLGDAEIPALLQKMIKQRRESLAIYEKAGRTEQARQEATEIAVIEEFLPKQMNEAEARDAIAAAIKEVGATGPKEMGKVMGVLKARFAGQMDFGKAIGLVKELLK